MDILNVTQAIASIFDFSVQSENRPFVGLFFIIIGLFLILYKNKRIQKFIQQQPFQKCIGILFILGGILLLCYSQRIFLFKPKYYVDPELEKIGVEGYYISAPEHNYSNIDYDTAIQGAKYYIVKESDRKYALTESGDKQDSAEPIDGFPFPSNERIIKSRSRKWMELSHPVNISPTPFYFCRNEVDTKYEYVSKTPCNRLEYSDNDRDQKNAFYNTLHEIRWSCDGGASWVEKDSSCNICLGGEYGLLKTTRDSCGEYGQWVLNSDPCVGTDDVCENFIKSVSFFNWYSYDQFNADREYFPSGSNNASDEKTYFAQSPSIELIKDKDTLSTAFKWYK